MRYHSLVHKMNERMRRSLYILGTSFIHTHQVGKLGWCEVPIEPSSWWSIDVVKIAPSIELILYTFAIIRSSSLAEMRLTSLCLDREYAFSSWLTSSSLLLQPLRNMGRENEDMFNHSDVDSVICYHSSAPSRLPIEPIYYFVFHSKIVYIFIPASRLVIGRR